MSKVGNSDPIGGIFSSLLKGIWHFAKVVIYGVKSLNSIVKVIGLFISILLSFFAYFKKDLLIAALDNLGNHLHTPMPVLIKIALWCVSLVIPLIYLAILGAIKDKDQVMYNEIFRNIGFIGKNNKLPYFLYKKEDGKKTIYAFKSNIPVADWMKAKDRLEIGLDCNIRKIKEGNKKGVVELIDYDLPEMLPWNDDFINYGDGVLCIGESDLGYVKFDLNRTPHVLVAGETGSGKSVILRCMLWQMIKKGCRIYMIDFKGGVEFGKVYEKYGEVITDRKRALTVLSNLVKENESRLKLFRELEVKNLKEYNTKTGSNLARIGVFIDEIGEMLDKKGASKEDKPIFEQLEAYLSTLARLSRATGINLFLGVQRPDANVLTGQIKNNVPVRISGRFADKTVSEIVLGNTAACNLPDVKGRLIYKVGNETIEFQSFYFDDEKDLQDIELNYGEMLVMKESKRKKVEEEFDDFSYPEESDDFFENTNNIDLDFDF